MIREEKYVEIAPGEIVLQCRIYYCITNIGNMPRFVIYCYSICRNEFRRIFKSMTVKNICVELKWTLLNSVQNKICEFKKTFIHHCCGYASITYTSSAIIHLNIDSPMPAENIAGAVTIMQMQIEPCSFAIRVYESGLTTHEP